MSIHQPENVGDIAHRELVIEAGLQGLFRVELEFAPRQFLVDRIVIQVFELAVTQLAVEALPEIVQFGGESLQLRVNGLAQPGDIQTFERFLFSFHGTSASLKRRRRMLSSRYSSPISRRFRTCR